MWFLPLFVLLVEPPEGLDPFDTYLAAPVPPADGFESPRGPGARLNAMAGGRVTAVADHSVTVDHFFYENNDRTLVHATYFDLKSVAVAAGDLVVRGQQLGELERPGRRRELHVRLEPPSDPAELIRKHASTFVPQREPSLVLVDTKRHRMRIFTNGQRDGDDLQVGFGQEAGCKEKHRDLRTPCGMYFVTWKSTGPFSGEYADYYGGHFIKLNYPNAYDAQRGVAAGITSASTARAIAKAWRARQLPTQGTRLGGGIGFHGWAEEWDDSDTARGSWGCVFLHNRDIAAAYERIPIGAMVVLL